MKTIAIMVFLCAASAFISCSQVHAFDPWDRQDYALHGVMTALHTIDMLQTLKIARNPDEYHERNPILGEHPSEAAVVGYFVGTWIAQTALVHVLPASCRPYAQAVMIAVPLGAVVNNFSVGLGFGF